jgi:hypothetical protein
MRRRRSLPRVAPGAARTCELSGAPLTDGRLLRAPSPAMEATRPKRGRTMENRLFVSSAPTMAQEL